MIYSSLRDKYYLDELQTVDNSIEFQKNNYDYFFIINSDQINFINHKH